MGPSVIQLNHLIVLAANLNNYDFSKLQVSIHHLVNLHWLIKEAV